MTKTLEEKISGLSPERQQKIQDMTSQLIAEEQTKMTTPSERINSIAYTEQFLLDLIDPKKTPRVPKEIRERAMRLLRHYPSKFDLEMMSDHDEWTS